jgi:hypothetical protein
VPGVRAFANHSQVKNLRRKVGDDPADPAVIQTVLGGPDFGQTSHYEAAGSLVTVRA